MYCFTMTKHRRLIALLPASIFIILFVFFVSIGVKAQTKALYKYQDLSSIYYAIQKDSLKKAWKCPVISSNKETQKLYAETWDSRTDFVVNGMENNAYVHDAAILSYLNGILSDIIKGNATRILHMPMVLLDRNSTVNAFSVGGNIILVNAGLVAFARDREEISLVLAHELSHQILNHADNAIKEKAEFLKSDEYKNSLNSVLDSRYERLSRLKKIFQGYSFSLSRHNRYHEGDADSLALVLLKNAGIRFDARYFLRLDSSDMQYQTSLRQPINKYFEGYGVPFEEWWTQKRTKGLSTKRYNFRDTTGMADSLRTHPDCAERYAKALQYSSLNLTATPVPSEIREKANRILIWNMFDNLQLTGALYRVLLQKDEGNRDEWYDFMVYNIFSGLYYADKQLNRFNAIGVLPKEYVSSDYLQLQTMLEQMPKENLEKYCQQMRSVGFWNKLSGEEKALQNLMFTIIFNDQLTAKIMESSGKEFTDNYPTSMYCEFADHFRKK